MSKRRFIAVGAALAGLILMAPSELAARERFASPEAAAKALIEAARSPEPGMVDRLFGDAGRALLFSGDETTDRQRRDAFLALAETGLSVVDDKDGRKSLVFGTAGWRFPIPLQAADGSWSFDLAAGQQEMANRLIGRNEIAAIGVCADCVAAQNEYRSRLHDDETVQQFAQRLLSTPGRRDGLYWTPVDAADRSPLGDRIAGALDASAPEQGDGAPRSYHGYVFRILTAQGPEAPGGAYDYMVKGRLLAGFALIATPLRWGQTGIMTFLCDQQGRVFERNLGERTSALAKGITRFDPGPGWSAVNVLN
jgi:hypothetical protein